MTNQTLHGWLKFTAGDLLMADGSRRNVRKLSYLSNRQGWWIKLAGLDGMIPLYDPSIDQNDLQARYSQYQNGSQLCES